MSRHSLGLGVRPRPIAAHTWDADKPRTNLVIVCEGDPRLANPYSVIAVDPKRFPHVNGEAARKYIEWLTSPATQTLISRFRVGGKVLFRPATR